MSAADQPLHFVPMCCEDLDWVVAAERELHAFPWTRGNFEDSLSAGYSCWVAWQGQQRIGYAVMMHVIDEAHLLDLSVAREAQRAGHGWALLAHTLQVAVQNGAQQMFLEVRPSNLAALSLYQRAGFVELGRRRNYYPALNGREDAIVMRRML